MVSPQFSVGRGTHQGLSLSLFVLAIEPIAIALRTSSLVKALEKGSIRKCSALYADNLLLFLQDPGLSLETVFKILNTFEIFSDLRVNWEKSSVMPIDARAQAQAAQTVAIP